MLALRIHTGRRDLGSMVRDGGCPGTSETVVAKTGSSSPIPPGAGSRSGAFRAGRRSGPRLDALHAPGRLEADDGGAFSDHAEGYVVLLWFASFSKNASVTASFSVIPQASVTFPSRMWKTFTKL